MLKSMTGYGKSSIILGEKTVNVEVRCVNSKQMDLNIRMISDLKESEPEIRAMASQILGRGKIELSVFTENNATAPAGTINKSLFKQYYQTLKDLSEEVNNLQNTDLFLKALSMPEVFTTAKIELTETDIAQLLEAVKTALNKADQYRIEEAKALSKDLVQRIHYIEAFSQQIEPFEADRIEALKGRLNKAFSELGLDDKIDQNRFEQELIYYLEKWDTTEEKVRLRKHCQYFLETLENEDNCGRKLGFIAQEIGREINTLGSKCNHSDIQRIVVRMKDELEKIKEQSLNIL